MRVKWPICGTPTAWDDNPYHPFCSTRCKIMDLETWAGEGYRIAGEKSAEDRCPTGNGGTAPPGTGGDRDPAGR